MHLSRRSHQLSRESTFSCDSPEGSNLQNIGQQLSVEPEQRVRGQTVIRRRAGLIRFYPWQKQQQTGRENKKKIETQHSTCCVFLVFSPCLVRALFFSSQIGHVVIRTGMHVLACINTRLISAIFQFCPTWPAVQFVVVQTYATRSATCSVLLLFSTMTYAHTLCQHCYSHNEEGEFQANYTY